MKKLRLFFLTTLFNERYLNNLSLNKERFLYKAERIPFAIAQSLIGSWVVLLLFPFVYFAYVAFQGIKVFILIVLKRHVELKKGSYFLATGTFTSTMNERINKYAPSSIWLLNTSVKKKNYVIKSNKAVCVSEVITKKDLFICVYNSLLTPILICKKFGTYFILLSLKSFNWYVFYCAASKIPFDSELFFIDHKDRWALLEDKIAVKKKSLIQHGKEAAVTPKNRIVVANGIYCHDMPYKFKKINVVYCFSDKEYIALTHSIIANSPHKIVIGFDFKTTPIDTSKFSVLIIGYCMLYEKEETTLISRLQDKDIELYVKGHPTQPDTFYQQMLTRYYFHYIKGSQFPKVNMVISYSSTLALEYESVGVEVLYHTVLSLDEIITRIELRRNEYTARNGR